MAARGRVADVQDVANRAAILNRGAVLPGMVARAMRVRWRKPDPPRVRHVEQARHAGDAQMRSRVSRGRCREPVLGTSTRR